MLKALVFGGRDWRGRAAVVRALTQLQPTSIIEGGCPTGADKFAREWARENGVPLLTVPADWATHGRAAGPIRNQRMIDEKPDVAVGFPGGKGTADMTRRVKAAGVRLIEPVSSEDSNLG